MACEIGDVISKEEIFLDRLKPMWDNKSGFKDTSENIMIAAALPGLHGEKIRGKARSEGVPPPAVALLLGARPALSLYPPLDSLPRTATCYFSARTQGRAG
jgi:hypothetical protein